MLYIFVEGKDDEEFFTRIFFCGEGIQCIQYSTQKAEKINNFIKSIKSIPNSDYLFFADADGKTTEEKKSILSSTYFQVEKKKLFIVHYEIESWYYAGVCENDCRKIKMMHFVYCTNDITKEMLIEKMPKASEKQYIMSKMLDFYSIDLAKQRNSSLNFFINQKESMAAV